MKNKEMIDTYHDGVGHDPPDSISNNTCLQSSFQNDTTVQSSNTSESNLNSSDHNNKHDKISSHYNDKSQRQN